jgi:rfaE bifunctional protein nucleotidyltransferase chain/domain
MHTKIKTAQEVIPLLAILKAAGRKIVFTNGCFDLIHTGHTRYLAKAKSLGDILIVAVNSDDSVRGIKGEKRPINTEADRMETLAALAFVDFVVSFHEPDPYRIISELQPDVLVKGGDWPVEKIIGRDIVEARGGRVISVGYIEGASTTGIIEKIVARYCEPVKEAKGKMVRAKEPKKSSKPGKAAAVKKKAK